MTDISAIGPKEQGAHQVPFHPKQGVEGGTQTVEKQQVRQMLGSVILTHTGICVGEFPPLVHNQSAGPAFIHNRCCTTYRELPWRWGMRNELWRVIARSNPTKTQGYHSEYNSHTQCQFVDIPSCYSTDFLTGRLTVL